MAALVDAIRDWRFSIQQPPGTEDLRTYLTVWFLVPIAFFSLSQSKLPGYILPAIPAGTILLASFIWRREQEGEKPSEWLALLHALLSAMMLLAALVVPFKMLKLDLPRNVFLVGGALAVTALLALWLSLRIQGYRVLRFVTLVPVIIAFALVLRGTAPIVNLFQSARPVDTAIHQNVLGQIPIIAVYDVPPALRYGLGFYGNQPVASYEQNEIPAFDHLVVAATGTQKELEYRLPGRSVTRIGGYAPQHLDFYVVSGKPSAETKP
jgi:4-amino-4-deoxy-L-arabinose transferase-like glycosyltransferase